MCKTIDKFLHLCYSINSTKLMFGGINMSQKKFIMTRDETTANKLLASGFRLLSNVSGTYTFVNDPTKFNFEQFDKKMVCFTNNLYI